LLWRIGNLSRGGIASRTWAGDFVPDRFDFIAHWISLSCTWKQPDLQRELKPPLTRPRDFDRFWTRTIEELNSVASELSIASRPASGLPGCELLKLSFASFDRARVRAYALRWCDSVRRPVVVHSHGYAGLYDIQGAWARAGFNVLGVDIRGFGRSRAAVPNVSGWGYVLTGRESPETSILRGAVCDYVRAVQIAVRLFTNRSRVVAHGYSFSGGLALMAEAVSPSADLLAVGVPTFGWAEGRHFFVKCGSGAEISRYIAARPDETEDLMVVLRYFDSMNFAGLVTCPTLLGLGLQDDVVPAKTVYAIANHLTGPVELMEFPVSHSNHPDERRWSEFEARWMQLARNDTGGLAALRKRVSMAFGGKR
jgi:cephalosporin-C deacetylase